MKSSGERVIDEAADSMLMTEMTFYILIPRHYQRISLELCSPVCPDVIACPHNYLPFPTARGFFFIRISVVKPGDIFISIRLSLCPSGRPYICFCQYICVNLSIFHYYQSNISYSINMKNIDVCICICFPIQHKRRLTLSARNHDFSRNRRASARF